MVTGIVIIALIALFTVIGARRGLARTLLNLAGFVAASAFSRVFAVPAAQWIYDSFIRQGVIDGIESSITKNGAELAASTANASLPDWLEWLISLIFAPFGADAQSLCRGLDVSAAGAAEQAAAAIEQPLGGIAVAVLSLVLGIVFFSLMMVLIKLAIKAVLRVFELPVIRGVNRFFGGLLGFCEGFAVSWLAIQIFYVIMTYASPTFYENEFYFGKIFQALCIFI